MVILLLSSEIILKNTGVIKKKRKESKEGKTGERLKWYILWDTYLTTLLKKNSIVVKKRRPMHLAS